ncbi:beta strand repeat-containing protein [Methanobrevibacter sp. DSM 116169]|uniref:beta strand repeat-containing protein n=1 Tax=Methanobrevibacter sp. DSM 116169 TaxID=3242727 RepID=UPI0038FC68C3
MKRDVFKIALLFFIMLVFSVSLVSAEGNFTSLQNQITNANEGIIINQNYTYSESNDNTLKEGVIINKDNFVIDGNNYTINGDNKARIFSITGDNVTIKNLNFINGIILKLGYVNGMGGAIYNSGNNTTLIDNVFSGNLAQSQYYIGAGGAIYNVGNLNINGGKFTDNTATSGGALYNEKGNIIINNVEFISNNCDEGGAIYNKGNLTIIDGLFKDHNSNWGAIIRNTGNITIKGGKFTNNYATQTGGVISGSGIVNIYGGDFINNRANTGGVISFSGILNIYDGNFINNTLTYSGGVISNSGTTNIYNGIFENNSATDGGVIYNSGIVNLYDGTFTKNNGETGGVININKNTVNMFGGEFILNSADLGGVIFNRGGIANIDNMAATNNTASQGTVIYNNYNFNSANNIIINNSILSSSGDGYLIYNNQGGVLFLKNNTMTSSYEKIYNYYGTIVSEVILTILDNDTITYSDDNPYIYATLTDDNNNTISTSHIIVNNEDLGEIYLYSNDNGLYRNPPDFIVIGTHIFTGDYSGGTNVTVKNGTLVMNKQTLDFNIDVYNVTYGDMDWFYLNIDPYTYPEDIRVIIKNSNNEIISDDSYYGWDYITLYDIAADNYTINITYVGDSITEKSTKIYNFTVYRAESYFDIEIADVNYGENTTLYVNLTNSYYDGLNAIINAIVNNKTYNIAITNGKGSVVLDKLPGGIHTVDVIFNGNQNYTNLKDNKTFNVNSIDIGLNIDVLDFSTIEDGIINITMFESDATGIVTVQILSTGEKFNITLVNGMASSILPYLSFGRYVVSAQYLGDNNYNSAINTTVFTVAVSEITMNLSTQDVFKNENATINVSFSKDDVTGNVSIIVNGIVYNVAINNGIASLILPKLNIGTYYVNAIFYGDNKYSFTMSNAHFDVNEVKKDIILSVNNLTKYYKGMDKLIAYLTDDEGNPLVGMNVTFIINGKNYTRDTNASGYASMNINLDPGNYDVLTIFDGFNNYSNASSNSNIKVISTVEGNNVDKMFKNDTQYFADLIDLNGNALANTNVSLNINGVIYVRETNENGTVKLSINLDPGIYAVTVTNPVNNQTFSNEITVYSTINGSDITKMFQNGTQYYANLYNDDGSVLANRTVRMNINGVMYYRDTNENGTVRLNINLDPDEYIITVYHPDNNQTWSNLINVLPILKGENLNKTFDTNASYDIKVFDDVGQPAIGANISININGVMYYRISNDDGIAKLNINLDPGAYIATATWKGFSTSNIVNVI